MVNTEYCLRTPKNTRKIMSKLENIEIPVIEAYSRINRKIDDSDDISMVEEEFFIKYKDIDVPDEKYLSVSTERINDRNILEESTRTHIQAGIAYIVDLLKDNVNLLNELGKKQSIDFEHILSRAGQLEINYRSYEIVQDWFDRKVFDE